MKRRWIIRGFLIGLLLLCAGGGIWAYATWRALDNYVPVWPEDVNAVASRKLTERGVTGLPAFGDRCIAKSFGRGWTVVYETANGEVSVDVTRSEAESFVLDKWKRQDAEKASQEKTGPTSDKP